MKKSKGYVQIIAAIGLLISILGFYAAHMAYQQQDGEKRAMAETYKAGLDEIVRRVFQEPYEVETTINQPVNIKNLQANEKLLIITYGRGGIMYGPKTDYLYIDCSNYNFEGFIIKNFSTEDGLYNMHVYQTRDYIVHIVFSQT